MSNPPEPTVPISGSLVISVRTFLSARPDSLSDDKRLSFETAVLELLDICNKNRPATQSAIEVVEGLLFLGAGAVRLASEYIDRRKKEKATLRRSNSRPLVPTTTMDSPFRTILEAPKGTHTQSAIDAGGETCVVAATTYEDESCVETDIPNNSSSVGAMNSGAALAELLSRPRLLTTLNGPFNNNLFTPIWLTAVTLENSTRVTQVAPFTKYFRGTLVFRAIVTASPSSRGCVAMSWQPYFFPGNLNARYVRARMPGVLSLPHVRFFLDNDTTATLRVPWYCPMDKVDPWSSLGYISLNNIIRENPGAGAAASIVVTCHLEDLEIAGPTSTEFVDVVTQSALEMEQKSVSNPVSSGLGQISQGLQTLGGVPLLKSISGPAMWATSLMAKTAASFGFSRPVVTTPATFAVNPGFNSHTDMPKPAMVVGPFGSNSLCFSKNLSPSGKDEMALEHVLSQPCSIFSGVWGPTGVSAGTRLYSARVSPLCLWYRDGSTNVCTGNIQTPYVLKDVASGYERLIQPSSISSLAHMFRFWRGSITFRVTFGANYLTRARVKFVFFPNPEFASTTLVPTASDPGTCPMFSNSLRTASYTDQVAYSKVHVIAADSRVVDFTVPFVFPTVWAGRNASIGSVVMFADSNIKATLETDPRCDFHVECFSTDMKFADFTGVRWAPATYSWKNGGFNLPQSFLYTQSSLGNALDSGPVEQQTVGEVFTSLKQLCMIPSSGVCFHKNATSTDYPDQLEVFPLLPWYEPSVRRLINNNPFNNGVSVASEYPIYGGMSFSPGAYVASFFAFARGGTVVEASGGIITIRDSVDDLQRISVNSANLGPISLPFTQTKSSPFVTSLDDVVRAILPYRRPTLFDYVSRSAYLIDNAAVENAPGGIDTGTVPTTISRVLDLNNSNILGWTTRDLSAPSLHYCTYHPTSQYSVRNVYVSAADDAYCSMFLGPPLVDVNLMGIDASERAYAANTAPV